MKPIRWVDAVLAGTLVVAGAVLPLGVAIRMLVALSVESAFTQVFVVQGTLRFFIDRDAPHRIPQVLKDGRLEPKARIPQDVQHVAIFTAYDPRWAYHVAGFSAWQGENERWTWSASSGLCLTDPRTGSLIGTLTDQGFEAGNRGRSSICDAYSILAESWESDLPPRLVYATKDGLYRADLQRKSIVKIAELQGRVYLIGSMAMTSGSATLSRVYALGPAKIWWSDGSPEGRYGSFDVPGSIRTASSSGAYEMCVGTDDRLILRAEISAGSTIDSRKFQVAVLRAEGEPETSYTYVLNAPPGAHFFENTRDGREKLYHGYGERGGASLFGRLAQVLTPPALWAATLWAASEYPDFYRVGLSEVLLRGFGGWGVIAAGATLIALAAVHRGLRCGQSWPALAGWFAAIWAFGIPMALAHWVLVRPVRMETCGPCGERQPPSRTTCRRCGAAIAGPAPEGVEILRPA